MTDFWMRVLLSAIVLCLVLGAPALAAHPRSRFERIGIVGFCLCAVVAVVSLLGAIWTAHT